MSRRFVFHLARPGEVQLDARGRYAPASLATEGFVHASSRDRLEESAALYFPGERPVVLRLDPRRLDAPLRYDATPRGPMPHVYGAIPGDAIHELSLESALAADDRVLGDRVVFVAFEGMTLLDLVGVLDPISRVASGGHDPSLTCKVVSLHEGRRVYTGQGLEITAEAARPPLGDVDLLVIPGGLGTRALLDDAAAVAWLSTYPENRAIASVCTGALLLGAMGRLRGLRATTHPSELARLPAFGAIPSGEARVVDEGQVVTAGGVACAIDLGLHLVSRIAGSEARAAIARQMCLP